MQGEERVDPSQGSESSEWDRLRREREAQGLSLEQVSAYLKLTERQLDAIEKGDLSALPGLAFSRGFVRNYARFLKLDPAPFVALIKDESTESVLPTEMYNSDLGRMPKDGGGSRFSALPALLIVVVVAIIIGAGWYFHWFESHEDTEALNEAEQSEAVEMHGPLPSATHGAAAVVSSPAAEASVPASEPAETVPGGSAPVPSLHTQAAASPSATSARVAPAESSPAADSAQLDRIVLAFDGDSWVEVRDASGKNVFSRMNHAGSVQEVQGRAPFSLVVGNASQVRLNWKGQAIDLNAYLKSGSQVARLTVK